MPRWTRRRLIVAALGASALGGGIALTAGSGGNVVTPGRSRARGIQTDASPPEVTDVVIIGGGIVGTSIALNLALSGVRVTVCEKGVIAGEASGRAHGHISTMGLAPFKLELINLSKRLWEGMNQAVQAETGYRRTGLISAFTTEQAQVAWEQWLKAAGPGAAEARMLNAKEASEQIPAKTRWRGALYDPTDGLAEPRLAAPAIAEGARRYGAKIVAPCAVRGLDLQAGKVVGVVTEKGRIRASTVILAGGCWSTLFAENTNVRLPTLSVFSTQVRVNGVVAPNLGVLVPKLECRPHIDGTYSLGATSGRIAITPTVLKHFWDFRKIILNPPWDVYPSLSSYFFKELSAGSRWTMDDRSPFESTRILEPTINTGLRDHLLERARTEFAGFADARVVEAWGGALNVTPDNVPVMGPVPNIPGFFMATGFSYGITMGPAVGSLMAQLVTGTKPSIDLTPYRYTRFAEGSPLDLTP